MISMPPVLILFFSVAGESAASFAIERARSLKPPSRPVLTNGGEYENEDYFNLHGDLIRSAWEDFGLQEHLTVNASVPIQLLKACENARKLPTHKSEKAIQDLFEQIIPGVVAGKILTPRAIEMLRSELHRARESGIPVRRPNAMNRYGVILDGSVNGAVANGLEVFMEELVANFVRPIAETIFPDIVGPGDASEFLAFTVLYNASKTGDVKLAEHRDASVVTMNLNLNTIDDFTSGRLEGSSLNFVDADNPGQRHLVPVMPGHALFHRGSLRHAASALQSGIRENLIIWLFGKDGWVREMTYEEHARLTPRQRWGRSMIKHTSKSVQSNKDNTFNFADTL